MKKRLPKKEGHDLVGTVVYGPVRSRRLGWSLGINFFAPFRKVCNIDCMYCQLGRTSSLPGKGDFLPVSVIMSEIEQALQTLHKNGQTLDVITISGNGEPALHPHLPEIVEKFLKVKHIYYPNVKTWILSNGTRTWVSSVANAFNQLDERAIKLDGVGELFKKIERPQFGLSLDKLVRGISQLKDYHLQFLLVNGRITNTSQEALEQWVQFVLDHHLKPKSIQLYTVDRFPAYPDVYPVSREKLLFVYQYLSEHLPFEITLFS